MHTIKKVEDVNHDRRQLLSTATKGIAAAGAASLLPSQLAAAPAADTIRPFRFEATDEQLADLRRRPGSRR
jgi:hypothetical protein